MIPDAAVLVAHDLRTPRRTALGCIVTAVCYLLFIGVLGVVIIAIGLMNAGSIKPHLVRTMEPRVLAASCAALDTRHSSGERAAFSNAVSTLFVRMESIALSAQEDQWMLSALERLLAAQKDQVILPYESAAFCTSVWRHTTSSLQRAQ